jgi:hypothetical protein
LNLLRLLKFVEIVEISVNFDHDHLMVKMVLWSWSQWSFLPGPFGKSKGSMTMVIVGPPSLR